MLVLHGLGQALAVGHYLGRVGVGLWGHVEAHIFHVIVHRVPLEKPHVGITKTGIAAHVTSILMRPVVLGLET